jgi:hypothetical protein
MVEANPSDNFFRPACKIVFLVANTFYGTLRGMQVNGENLYKPPNLPLDVDQARTDLENAKKGAISCFGGENIEFIELYDCSFETLRKEVSKLGPKIDANKE